MRRRGGPRRARPVALATALVLLAGPAAAQRLDYGQCQDRAKQRLELAQRTPAIDPERARMAYQADIQGCQSAAARERARDAQQQDQQRLERQRLDQRLEQQRQRQRDDMQRSRR